MDILFTTLSLVALAGCIACAIVAWNQAIDAGLHASLLKRANGALSAVEADLASLTAQHQKLRGKFYASQQHREHVDEDAPAGETDRERLRRTHAAAILPAGIKHNGG